MMEIFNTGFSVSEDGYLIGNLLPSNQSYSLSLRLLKLKGNEFQLNGGRFSAFSFREQRHRVLIWSEHWQPVIDWIEEHIVSTWSWKAIITHDVSHTDFVFSFADGVEAALFALRWR
jgi:hypothetical protein